ncbi:histidine kinase [Actinoplanes sp. NPDC051633]|uniref:sensor histidine kinase n=1 Tax=Actinoplanes sp. NPDC051633 TaxID=3155670 RepID=UPI00342199EC
MWRGRTARQWLLEAGLGLVAVVLGVFFAVESVSEGAGTSAGVEVVTGTLSFVALLLFRRSHPVALTVVLIPAGIVFAMPMGAIPVALFAVALHRPARTAIVLTLLHAAAVVVIYRLAIPDTRLYVETVVFLVLLHISVVAVAMVVRSHRMLVRSWAERARQAEEGQRMRIEQARLAEREQIAREMHDVLAHRISLLAVHAGALEVRRDAPADEQAAAGVIRQCAYDALEDLREVIGVLRDQPPEVRPQPTLRDVPALVEECRQVGVTIDLDLEDTGAVPDGLGRHAYRIVQEGLTNARKHAPGAPVRVAVRAGDGDGLVVEVDNALRPAAAVPGAGAGLAGLRERVMLVGGSLEHGPTPGGRFHLAARLPWPT